VAVIGYLILGFACGAALMWVVSQRLSRRSETRSVTVESPHEDGSQFLAEVLDALTIGIVVASKEGDIVYRNSRATGLTRAAHTEVLVEEAVDNFVRAAIDGQVGRKVLDLFGPPRQVISVSALPLAGGGALAMIEDTTERALVDAVRTDFVANISHELKTPIGALAVLAETLSQVDDLEITRRLSVKISDEAIRVGRLIDDLLELSRLEYAGELSTEVVVMSQVVTEATERMHTLAESSGISIVVGSIPDFAVRGDRRQLVSALQNLLENAIKYSDRGSSVDVGVRLEDGRVAIDISDHGVGIPAKELDRIFERFYRVDRARSRETGGTGLGLAIARHIATNHGGEIQVRSTEGVGSTFTLFLPEGN
jgi:two-component system sensor histidine kinase SenX3